jgi:DNA polymerase-3 subunit gamma/tau
MAVQAKKFGDAELSRAADVANAALTEMTGATSPRLHLELMVARILVPESDESERGALARVERLERRIGVDGSAVTAPPVAPVPKTAPSAAKAPEPPVPEPTAPAPTTAVIEAVAEAKTVTLQQVKDAWPEVLESVQKASRNAWMVVFTAAPLELRDNNVLVISFPSQKDVEALKQPSAPGEGVGDHLKEAISTVLGIRPALLARADAAPIPTASADEIPEPTEPDLEPAVDEAGWAVAEIPGSVEPEPVAAAKPDRAPKAGSSAPAKSSAPASTPESQRYGESVVREILGASFIEEQAVAPRVTPRDN